MSSSKGFGEVCKESNRKRKSEKMLAEPYTITNPKNGDQITSCLTQDEVFAILQALTFNSFAQSLYRQRDNLRGAQNYWAVKIAEDNKDIRPVEPITLASNIGEFVAKGNYPRLMWKLEEKARIKLYPKDKGRVDIVHSGGDYSKRVGYIEENKFYPLYRCPKVVKAQIYLFSLAPMEFMKEHGKQWGICCVCGRQLENETSVSRGIGPICESRWG